METTQVQEGVPPGKPVHLQACGLGLLWARSVLELCRTLREERGPTALVRLGTSPGEAEEARRPEI